MGAPSRRRARLAPALLLSPLLLLGSAPLGAQQAGPLDAFVREALEKNAGLRQQRLADQRSEAALREARAHYLPSVSLDARYSRTQGARDLGALINPAHAALNTLMGTDAFPTDVSARLPLAQETKVRLTQPLFQPALRHNVRIHRSLREIQGAGLRGGARQLAADVQGAYLALASAERVVELLRNTLPLLAENVRFNERLVANGRATSEGVYRARAEAAETEQRLAEAVRERDAARRAFNFLLDRPLDAAVEAVPDSHLVLGGAEVSLDEAVRRALAGREELRQAEHAISAAEAQGRVARSAYLPEVSLAVDYGIQGDRYELNGESDFAVASLVMQWSVFNGGQDAARRRMADLDAERARTRRAETERQVEMQVRQAYEAVSVARAAIATADARLAAARRTFELVSRRYEEGMAPHVEYVDARTAFTSAELNRILTRYEHALRWVELERVAALREMD